jgi:hypothetical protein
VLRFAQLALRIHDPLQHPQGAAAAARVAHVAQVLGEEVQQAADGREAEQDEDPVLVPPGAHGMHRKEQGNGKVNACEHRHGRLPCES